MVSCTPRPKVSSDHSGDRFRASLYLLVILIGGGTGTMHTPWQCSQAPLRISDRTTTKPIHLCKALFVVHHTVLPRR